MVHRKVSGDAVKPRGELGFRRIGLARTINTQENFLRQFFASAWLWHMRYMKAIMGR